MLGLAPSRHRGLTALPKWWRSSKSSVIALRSFHGLSRRDALTAPDCVVTGAESCGLSRGRRRCATEREVQELALRLQSNPALVKRLAGAVDPATAQQWKAGRAVDESGVEVPGGDVAAPPTMRQLWQLHVRIAVPFVGFGFFDNTIMLTVGEALDTSFGVVFGFSTLAAAGMGQMVSDSAGITLQGLIERCSDRLGLPAHGLSREQLELNFVQNFMIAARIIGIVFGCFLGMFPLLFIPEKQVRLVDAIVAMIPEENRAEFIQLVDTQFLSDGDKLLQVGEVLERVFFIQRGDVNVVGRDAGGVPLDICTLQSGHAFGEPDRHKPSFVDLKASSSEVVVQSINKADFVRLTGKAGMEVLENAKSSEHKVYLAFFEADTGVPQAVKGTGKVRRFAALTDDEKVEVLKCTGLDEAKRFTGRQSEGKVSFFASLSEEQKRDALILYDEQKP